MRYTTPLSIAGICLMAVWLLGCSPPPTSSTANGTSASSGGGDHGHSHDGHSHDGHNHAHGHSHADTGPNGGHIIELGEEEYHAEWVHDDESGKLTVFILDKDVKQPVPIPAGTISIVKKIGDDAQVYELAAVDPQGDPAKASKFEITDKPLIEALKTAGEGVEATLNIKIDDKPYSAKIEHHQH